MYWQHRRKNYLQITQDIFVNPNFNSSVGFRESEESTLTTPQVEEESVPESSPGINASPSVSFGSLIVRFSARDLVNISRYCVELEKMGDQHNEQTKKT